MASVASYMYGIAPDKIIPDFEFEDGRNERDILSRHNFCHVQIERWLHDDMCRIRVSPSRDWLEDPMRSERIYITRAQFAQILPWDNSWEYLSTEELGELVTVHAVQLNGGADTLDPNSTTASPCKERSHQQGLAPIFVPCEIVEDAQQTLEGLKEIAESSRQGQLSWLQRCWLCSMQFVIEAFRKKSDLPYWMGRLDKSIKEILRSPFSMLERLVRAKPIYHGKERIGWNVRVIVPLAFA
jgi:hypothetical protein